MSSSSSSVPAEPTASERRSADDARRAKEKEEQALLPYKWIQTLGDVDITIPIDGTLKARDLIVEFDKKSLKVGVKGSKELIIDVCFLFVLFILAYLIIPVLAFFLFSFFSTYIFLKRRDPKKIFIQHLNLHHKISQASLLICTNKRPPPSPPFL